MADGNDNDLGQWIDCGRGYGNFHRGQYLLPVDAKEQERLDIMHTLVLAARPKPFRLHHAPFIQKKDPHTNERPRVLDLGFGTGIWLLDMAEKYGETEFYGIDMSNMAPSELYHNIDLRSPVDYESPWALGEGSFDFIHLQMGLGSVGNWPRLYEKIYKHLKPGGWFEHVEIDWTPRCDNGSLRKGKFTDWWDMYVSPPYTAAGRPISYQTAFESDIGGLMQQKGFRGMQCQKFRVPTNSWSGDRAEHVSGTWWNIAMSSGDSRGHGFEALSLAVLTRFQQWPESHARKLCEDVMVEASDPNIHAYNWLYVWWAQKPANAPP